MEDGKYKDCNNCNGFIPKSTKPPYNAFDYIAGNVIGACNNDEDVMPLSRIVNNCNMWEEQ